MNSCKTIFTLASILALATGCGTFHGKVVDQNYDPVPKAEVCVSYTTPSLTGCLLPFLPDWRSVVHHRWKTIKKDGTFRVIGFHGYNWRISTAHAARKTGYEYQHAVEHDSENDFYLIRMRKRTNPCFLHHEPHASCQFLTPGRTITWDFVEREQLQTDPPKKRPNSSWPLPRHTPDVVLQAQMGPETNIWQLSIKATSDTGGILCSSNIVYEAPLNGYAPQVDFTVPVSRNAGIGAKCIIIRSRDPSIFTRLDVTYVNATPKFFRLSVDAYTNPYGNRSLDIDPRSDKLYSIRKMLTEVSRKAWQQGHPPERPDFSELLRSVDEFAEH